MYASKDWPATHLHYTEMDVRKLFIDPAVQVGLRRLQLQSVYRRESTLALQANSDAAAGLGRESRARIGGRENGEKRQRQRQREERGG